jgi:hypothetical protein
MKLVQLFDFPVDGFHQFAVRIEMKRLNVYVHNVCLFWE